MRRAAFTLVELLVTIAIIAILAGFVLGALYRSQESAKAARSTRTVTLLHEALMGEWEAYRTRRLPVTKGIDKTGAVINPDANGRSQETDIAFLNRRLAAIRQMMRMDMPDRYKDLTFTPPDIRETSKRSAYLRRIATHLAAHNIKRAAMVPPLPALSAAQYAALIEQEHESSECLYLILSVGSDPEVRSTIKGRDVGDTDNDGMPEILDGWGRPIHWLRWAPGVVSDLQTQDPLSQHDPFDPLRLQTSATTPKKSAPPVDSGASEAAPPAWGFALTPLIFSAGPDGEYGIFELPQEPVISAVIAAKNNNPYSRYDNGVGFIWRGSPQGSEVTHQDNIHNHALGLRQ